MMTTGKKLQKGSSDTVREGNNWKFLRTGERFDGKVAGERSTYSRRVGEEDDDREIL